MTEPPCAHPEATTCSYFGQSYNPLEGPQLEDPYAFYAEARRQQPIFFSEKLQAWIVTRYDDVRTVLSKADIFSSKDALRPTVAFTPEVYGILGQGYRLVSNTINSDGERHKLFRRPLNIAFEPRRVNAVEAMARQIAHRLVDGFYEQGKADIIAQFAMPFPLEIILAWFGIPQHDLVRCKQWSDDMQALFQSPLAPDRQAQCARSYVAFQHYLARLIEERRQTPQDDVISLMLTSPLTEDDLVIGLVGLLLAGHETTASLIGNALYMLLSEPELWRTLCEQLDLIPTAIEESLRFDGPVQAFYRTATKNVQVGDTLIPQGALLLVVFGSANRDESKFSHAGQCDLGRFPNEHLAFGFGTHKCVGAPLARLEGRIALEVLSQRLPRLRLNRDQELSHKPNLQFRSFNALHVQWDVEH